MITAADIVAEALTWEGVPYKHQRRSRRNVDCAGLIVVVGWATGVWPQTFDVQGYPRDPDGTIKAKLLAGGMICRRQYGPREAADDVAPGEVVLMGHNRRMPGHLGICVGREIVHASRPFGRVIRHRCGPPYTGRVCATYRWPGVVYG